MFSKRIRLSAAVLILSFAVLMASAGEARAANGQGIPKIFAVCASGRCVRIVGHVVTTVQGQVAMRYGAILMLDLVYKYLGADTTMGGNLFPDVHISYYRSMMYVETSDSNLIMQIRVFLGLPSAVIAEVHIPSMDAYQIFLGLGSFYYKMEPAPWL